MEHKGYKVLLQLSMPYNYTLRHAVKFHINITSTENNYKANVNLTGGKHWYSKFGSEPKLSNKRKQRMQHKSKFNDVKENI